MTNSTAKTLLAIGAHHDDNELLAGTLHHHVCAGWRVISLVMTDGRYINGQVKEANISIREAESKKAAELLGVETVFLRVPEGQLADTPQIRLQLTEQIRRLNPEVVITHPPVDYHLDHMTTSQITQAVCHLASNPCYKTESKSVSLPRLYFCDAWFVSFEPDQYVDISNMIDLKIGALSCHKSQINITENNDDDMISMAKIRSRHRGIEAGVAYAEAFRLVPAMGSVRLTSMF